MEPASSERLHSGARRALLWMATLSFALCGALFIWVMLSDKAVEQAAQAFVKMRIEKEAHDLLGLDSKGNVQSAMTALQKRFRNDVALALQSQKTNLSAHIERTVIRLCGCDGRSAHIEVNPEIAAAQSELAAAENKLAQLTRFIENRYATTVAGLTRDVRIFLGCNTVLFSIVALLAWLRPRAALHLYLPGGVLWLATLASAALYLFGQNWFFTLLHNSFMGYAYLGYALGIFIFLCDITFWRGRATRAAAGFLAAVIGTTLSLASC